MYRLRLDLEPLPLAPAAATPLGLLLHETLSNAFAVPAGGGGRLAAEAVAAVQLRREPDGWTRLVVEARGRAAAVAHRPGSVGARLVAALARQVGGAVEVAPWARASAAPA